MSMTDEQRAEIMRRQAEGMRAMSAEEMACRQRELAPSMQQRGPLTRSEAEGMGNFWPHVADAPLIVARSPSWRENVRRWFRRFRSQDE